MVQARTRLDRSTRRRRARALAVLMLTLGASSIPALLRAQELPEHLDRLLGPDTVHQGVLLEAGPLPLRTLDDVDPNGILLVLDQVTDPHLIRPDLLLLDGPMSTDTK